MTTSQRQAARKFVEYWTFQRGSEKGEDQQFWNSLLGEVLGVADVKARIKYQVPVQLKDTTKFLDAWIPETRVLIEHKSRGVNLDAPQSGHDGLTPYEQAAEYDAARPFDEKARWIVTCNFDEFRIYDRTKPLAPPLKVRLGDLPKEAYRIAFLVNPKEKAIDRELEISVQAGRIVGEIYDALLKQMESVKCKMENEGEPCRGISTLHFTLSTLHSNYLAALNRLCVRLVFCLYAEDADIFPKDCFRRLLENTPAPFLRKRLIDLFQTLDTPPDRRDPYLEPELCAFPYTNGGLFRMCGSDKSVASPKSAQIGEAALSPLRADDIPPLTEEIRQLLIGASQFDWHDITPTIFGALFESTLNPVTRRAGGMVYTSVENIHKVIDPLFLDDLTRRVEAAIKKGDKRSLLALQVEMASITFLDPACGSGNFLTETYICLRRLENRIIAALQKGQGEFDLGLTIKVSIAQFYGLEINDFAVAVAKTALWIAESQMMEETAAILHREPDYLPLKDNANIVEGNALRIDWLSLLNANEELRMKDEELRNHHSSFLSHHSSFDFIIGNPPFLGYSSPGMTAESKADLAALFPKAKFLDYVCCWYKKAAALMQGTATRCAFVSTNSITQGEQVAPLWKDLNCEIDFAHRTFIWDNEATEKAHVHCVIIGFHAKGSDKSVASPKCAQVGDAALSPLQTKIIYDNGKAIPAKHINGYLMDADDAYIGDPNPCCAIAPQMINGSKPVENGNLFLSPEERAQLLKSYPAMSPFIRLASGSDEYINGIERWCLWLVGASPAMLRSCPPVMDRIAAVREFRLASTKDYTRRSAERPSLFQQIRQPDAPFIIIPRVSSENRRYIPIGFLQPDVVPLDSAQFIPNATLFHFAILISSVHMAWMRVVAGRLKSDYRYSSKIVYNSFVWPTDEPSAALREELERTGQAILDARAAHPESSLADLYDPLTMPADLRAAHAANDRAVLAAYGLKSDTSEPEIVAHLFKLYAEMAEKQK